MTRVRDLFSALALAFTLVASPAFAESSPVEVGKAAPAFTLSDTAGKSHKLSDFAGKWVVLEWVNYECPFVKKHYDTGNMQRLQKEFTADGVVWLSVNSAAEGKQGFVTPSDGEKAVKDHGASITALLLDTTGSTGKLYAAKTTPHMYLIDPKGTLVYAGAIDDKASTDKDDVAGAKNYLKEAYAEGKSGKAITTASTTPYGCSVKYAG